MSSHSIASADAAGKPGAQPTAIAGNLFVVSAPSGAGKTSLVKAALAEDASLHVSVSHTTRAKRADEQDGVNYHFVGESEFTQLVAADGFVEHAHVFGNWYGTSHRELRDRLAAQQDLILEIDWQGAEQIQRLYPEQTVSIFILPPSLEALRARLHGRGQDESSVIESRLAQAQDDMAHCRNFDYLVVNDDFDTALQDVLAILRAARHRTHLLTERSADLLAALLPAG